jgi:short-subunit dehydrogenase
LQTIMITGSSSGIGRALALQLASEKNRLILVARRREELQKVKDECLKNGAVAVEILLCDVSDPDNAREIVHTAEVLFNGIDVLVVNAGISRHLDADKLTWEHFKAIYDTNVYGAVSMVIAAIPKMLAQGHGQIIGVSSIAGFRGLPSSAAYSSSKSALTSFLEAIRIELAPRIAISVVSPGFVKTALTEKNKFPMPFLMTPEKAARIISRGIHKKKRHIAFPWVMVGVMRFLQILPASLYDRLLSVVKP